MPESIELKIEGPLEVAALTRYLNAHAIPGCEVAEEAEDSHCRLVMVDGRAVRVDADFRPSGVRVVCESGIGPELEATVRIWLDLDRDVFSIANNFREDPLLGPLVTRRPGLRLVGYPDGFEGAVMTVLGQQVSLAAARTFGGRLAAAFGSPGPGGLTLFPGASSLLQVPVDEIQKATGITGQRARTIAALAAAFDGGLRLEPGDDQDKARKQLLDLPGVGPWTVEYLAMRALRDPDAFPSGDLVLRKVLGGVTAKEAERIAEPWRPWRAYAVIHLWTEWMFAGG